MEGPGYSANNLTVEERIALLTVRSKIAGWADTSIAVWRSGFEHCLADLDNGPAAAADFLASWEVLLVDWNPATDTLTDEEMVRG